MPRVNTDQRLTAVTTSRLNTLAKSSMANAPAISDVKWPLVSRSLGLSGATLENVPAISSVEWSSGLFGLSGATLANAPAISGVEWPFRADACCTLAGANEQKRGALLEVAKHASTSREKGPQRSFGSQT